jgi:transcriptional regulator with XRE-family HTH domain
MDDVRIGARVRALRHRLAWRQQDLAGRAGVSQGLISLVERGHIEQIAVGKLRRIARALDAEYAGLLRWRGGDLDRLMDEGHARLVGRVAETLQEAGWEVRFEVSYSVFGERGSIDVLAWHEAAKLLLVVEVKTALVAVEETLRKHDEKVRLAQRIAAQQFNWLATGVGRLLVFPGLSTPRRRVARHRAVMGAAYPLRGADLRRWLAEPRQAAAGLAFVDLERGYRANQGSIGRKRIRPRRQQAA